MESENKSYSLSPPGFGTGMNAGSFGANGNESGNVQSSEQRNVDDILKNNGGGNGQDVDLAALLSMPQLRLSGSPLGGFNSSPPFQNGTQQRLPLRASRSPPPAALGQNKIKHGDEEQHSVHNVSRDDASVETGSTNSEPQQQQQQQHSVSTSLNWPLSGTTNKRYSLGGSGNSVLGHTNSQSRPYIREGEALWMPTDRPESAPPPPLTNMTTAQPRPRHRETANIALLVRSLSELTAVVARHGEDLRALREESRLYARRETLHETLTAISHATREDATRTTALLTRLEAKLDSLDRRLAKLEGTVDDQQHQIDSHQASPASAPITKDGGENKHTKFENNQSSSSSYSGSQQQPDFSAWAPEFRPNADFHSPLVLDDSTSFQHSLLHGSVPLQDHHQKQQQNNQHHN